MTVAVLTEKPSVARDIARVLGADRRGPGCLHGNGHVVTWAFGHLVEIAEPHRIRAEWKQWRADLLPIVPDRWPLDVRDESREQFDHVSRVLNDDAVHEVICATDAGREGELIFRYVYEACGCRKPVRRLWISSLTEDAIRAGLAELRPADRYDGLADAARARSRADWLVGMNFSRAYTLAGGETFSVGRVQTPTLAMLVERERAIRDFVPEEYLEVQAVFRAADGGPGGVEQRYSGTYLVPGRRGAQATRLPADGEEAARVVRRATAGAARVRDVTAKRSRVPPPQLYDLTELQRHANRLHGFSAKRTLDLAQTLYESRKLISYPRTDSRVLSSAIVPTLGRVVEAVAGPYRDRLSPRTGREPLGRRFVDDARVTDHHAIIPTSVRADLAALGADERRIYDLVCRRLLQAWQDEHVYSATTVLTDVATPARPDAAAQTDTFRSTGTRVEQIGWKALEPEVPRRSSGAADREQLLPTSLAAGVGVDVVEAAASIKRTRPPRPLTDATLLTAMETAGRGLDSKELSAAMRERGLGTPATRAAIIETLLRRGYAERRRRALVATERGMRLIDAVHSDVRSPAMTGEWEARLQAMQRGAERFDDFMKGIELHVREVVARVLSGGVAVAARSEAAGAGNAVPVPHARAESGQEPGPTTPREPVAPDDLGMLLREAFGFESFRPYQEAVCRAVTAGRDVLLVMPTGAGKSLCYQLPGLARGGTTLVVSPLIALMEDQVAKLQQGGLRAERIHSGRPREESRRACQRYLEGSLDFLFIAPERLGVRGFPEMLARRKPCLIAVDEAHCISQWGHDFRPDYRMLNERLPLLRPAPIAALTATATPLVQRDIVEQLGIPAALNFIHGFRRTNLAVEVAQMAPAARTATALRLLSDAGNRPAIVYAPTRKNAAALADALAASFPAAAYHAGLAAAERDRVQSAFLAGELQVIVATIAFGMGIDKADVRTVIHAALPASIEGYYQEIGRAGRDGLPSRAVLLHGFGDRKTHEYFLDRDYPEPRDVERIFSALGERPEPKSELARRLRLDDEDLDRRLEKLWIHGGAVIDPAENVSRGDAGWARSYAAQRRHKVEQLALITRYTDSRDCRMLHLVRHFGDQEDSGAPCGHCDVCAPEGCIALRFRTPSAAERADLECILSALRSYDGQSSGRLHREVFGERLDRRRYEKLAAALSRAGLVEERRDSFEKDGRVIEFGRLFLTASSRGSYSLDGVPVAVDAAVPPRTRRASPRKPRGGRGPSRRSGTAAAETVEREAPAELVDALKQWRLGEARRRRVPAFRILTDRTLLALASAQPQDEQTLLAVRGIGPTLARKYGEDWLDLVRAHR